MRGKSGGGNAGSLSWAGSGGLPDSMPSGFVTQEWALPELFDVFATFL